MYIIYIYIERERGRERGREREREKEDLLHPRLINPSDTSVCAACGWVPWARNNISIA